MNIDFLTGHLVHEHTRAQVAGRLIAVFQCPFDADRFAGEKAARLCDGSLLTITDLSTGKSKACWKEGVAE